MPSGQEIGKYYYVIEANGKLATAEITKLEKSMSKMGGTIKQAALKGSNELKKMGENGKKAGENISKGAQNAQNAIGDFVKKALTITGVLLVLNKVKDALIKLTADAMKSQAQLTKFNTVFKGMEREAAKMRDSFSAIYGVAIDSATELYSGLQDLIYPMTKNRELATQLTDQFAQLAGKVAAFSGEDTATVLNNIKSALVGNTVVVRKYGIIINDARLKQAGWTQGMSQSEKIMAQLKIITEDSSDAINGFANSTKNFAYQWNVLISLIQNKLADFGASLLPVWAPIIRSLTDLIDAEGRLQRLTTDLVSLRSEYNEITKKLSGSTDTLTGAEKRLLEVRQQEVRLDLKKKIDDFNKTRIEEAQNSEKLRKENEKLNKLADEAKTKYDKAVSAADNEGAVSKFLFGSRKSNLATYWDKQFNNLNTKINENESKILKYKENILQVVKDIADAYNKGLIDDKFINNLDSYLKTAVLLEARGINNLMENLQNSKSQFQKVFKEDVKVPTYIEEKRTLIEYIDLQVKYSNLTPQSALKKIDSEINKELKKSEKTKGKSAENAISYYVNLQQERQKNGQNLTEDEAASSEKLISLLDTKLALTEIINSKQKEYDDKFDASNKNIYDSLGKTSEAYEVVLGKFKNNIKLNNDDYRILQDKRIEIENYIDLLSQSYTGTELENEELEKSKQLLEDLTAPLETQLSLRDSIIASYNTGATLNNRELSILAKSNVFIKDKLKSYHDITASGLQLTKAQEEDASKLKSEYDENNSAITETIKKTNETYLLGEKIADGIKKWSKLTEEQKSELEANTSEYENQLEALKEMIALGGKDIELKLKIQEILTEQAAENAEYAKDAIDNAEGLTEEEKKAVSEAQKAAEAANGLSSAIDGATNAMRTLKDESASNLDKIKAMHTATQQLIQGLVQAGAVSQVLGAQLNAALSIIGVAISAFSFISEALGMNEKPKTSSGGSYDYSGQIEKAQSDRREKAAQAWADEIGRIVDIQDDIKDNNEDIIKQQEDITDIQKKIAETEIERTLELEKQNKEMADTIQKERIRRFENELTAKQLGKTKEDIKASITFYQKLLSDALNKGLDTSGLENTIAELQGKLKTSLTYGRGSMVTEISKSILNAKIETPEIAELQTKQLAENIDANNTLNDLYNQLSDEYEKLDELKQTQIDLGLKYDTEVAVSQQMYTQLLGMGLSVSELDAIQYGVLNGITDANQILSGLPEGLYELQKINEETNSILKSLGGSGSFGATTGGGGGIKPGVLIGGGLGALGGFLLGGPIGAIIGGIGGALFGGLFHEGGYIGDKNGYSKETRDLLEKPLKA
ncbi:MAG: hypothetical protein PHW73_07715, partial [Atribacterota bacterium]|nr:hypothetical protein [Atribacterota bacterium]